MYEWPSGSHARGGGFATGHGQIPMCFFLFHSLTSVKENIVRKSGPINISLKSPIQIEQFSVWALQGDNNRLVLLVLSGSNIDFTE